jgi:hypothetical protein
MNENAMVGKRLWITRNPFHNSKTGVLPKNTLSKRKYECRILTERKMTAEFQIVE